MPSSVGDSTIRTKGAEWLKAFSLALRNVGLYSAGHPRARESCDRAYTMLRSLLEGRRELRLSCSEGHLFLDTVSLDRDREISRSLARDLSSRGIEQVTFTASATSEDCVGLLRCLLMQPDRIDANGGFRKVMAAERVGGIHVEDEAPHHGRGLGETSIIDEMVLLDFLTHLDGGSKETNADGAPTADSILSRAPAALSRAISRLARDNGGWSSSATIAGLIAARLERIGSHAIQESARDRGEVVKDLGKAVLGTDPEFHLPLFLEVTGPGSEHRIVTEAVESLTPGALGDLVAIHYPSLGGDCRDLARMLDRAGAWRLQRAAALDSMRQALRAVGTSGEEIADLVDRLLWAEVDNRRRLELLYKDDGLWRMSFSRVDTVFVDLLDSGQVEEASSLVKKYLGGLTSPDLATRRGVARELRGLIERLDGNPSVAPLLQPLEETALARLVDEPDDAIAEQLSEALCFLGDRMLGSGRWDRFLALCHRADRLIESAATAAKERGQALAEGLSRCGDAGTMDALVEAARRNDVSSTLAVSILERGRIPALVERLASESDRSRRSELVNLLKGMATSRPAPFARYLQDSRWFLVRNVVAILGSTANRGVLATLDQVAKHTEPRVRKEYVRAISQIPEAEDRIVKTLADRDPRVQVAAIHALVARKSRRSLDPLVALIRVAPPYEGSSQSIRQEAVLALGKLGFDAAFAVLSEIVGRKTLLGHVEPTDLRVAATKALGLLGTPQARAVLEDLAAGDPRAAVREAAAQATRKSSSPA
jgi:HEAT repeat protein